MRKIILLFVIFCSPHLKAAEISIIGAGLSGLTCAYRLQQQGYDVTVYEALDRAGGRVLTHYEGDSFEELGGKYLNDGGDAVHISALAYELGEEIVDDPVSLTLNLFYQGQIFPFHSLFEELTPPSDDHYQYLQEMSLNCNHFGEVLDCFFKGQPMMRHLMEVQTRNYEGSDPSALSVNYFESFWDFYKRVYENLASEKQGKEAIFPGKIIRGGNSRLIHALSAAIGDKIQFQMPLKRIERTADGKLLLHFKNGQQKFTDYLILTVPVPILKEIEFGESLLPLERLKILNDLCFGSNAKILIPVTSSKPICHAFGFTQNAIIWFNFNGSVLTLYFGGGAAQFGNECYREIYRRELPALRQLLPDVSFPSEDRITCQSWVQEPYFKGSYSNYGVKTFDLMHEVVLCHDIPVSKVFFPLQDVIFFAGEATALEYPSTMEGAVESSERMCRLIHKIIERKEPSNGAK